MSAFGTWATLALIALLMANPTAGSRAEAQARPVPGIVDGVVTDTSLHALADATISILGSNIRVVTGASGRFRIRNLVAGQYLLAIHRLGYAPTSVVVRIAERDTVRLSFALELAAPTLDTVAITATHRSPRLAEFEEHRRLGLGQFMTGAQIDQRNSVIVKELLRTFMGVEISEAKDIALNRRAGIARDCPFKFFLDGVAVRTPHLEVDLPTPKDLAGIEVYANTATVPLQYSSADGGAFCGVILLWSKDGSGGV